MIGVVSSIKCNTGTSDGNIVKFDCTTGLDRCASVTLNGVTTYSCMASVGCNVGGITCCDTDYCNAGTSAATGFGVIIAAIASYFM